MAHEVRQPGTSGVAARAIALVLGVSVGSVVWLCLPPYRAAAQGEQPSPRAVSQGEKARARFQNRLREGRPPLLSGDKAMDLGEGGAPGLNGPAYAPYVAELTCGADLVATAGLLASRSMLNESETAIFTDYRLHVEDAIRSTFQLPPDKSVTLTLPGGTVLLDGRQTNYYTGYRALDDHTEYLVFLQYRLDLDAYLPVAHDFLIANDSDRPLSWKAGYWSPPELFYRRVSFASLAADVRAAAAHCS